MKSVRNARSGYRISAQKLKRARHLYARIIRKAVHGSTDRLAALMRAADRMSKAKLLWSCSLAKDVAFSILRVWQRDDDARSGQFGGPFGWHRWRDANGWNLDEIRNWKRLGSRRPVYQG